MDIFDVIVIGAGPAGMMAAIRAGERGRKTLLLEQTDSPGKKLLISGKGRCNLTNTCDVKEFLDKFSASRDFLRNAFARFFNTDLILFFESSGLALKTERGGRVFPTSDRAGDVLAVLQSRLKDTGAAMLSGERVSEVMVEDNKVAGVLSGEPPRTGTGSGKRFSADRVVIATGGLSYPETGSTGDGYGFARQLGHKVVPPKPALSAVVIKETFIRDWQGISLRNVLLTLWSGDKRVEERFGEMLFTHFGVSGPAVLDISAAVYDALEEHHDATLSINLKPALDNKMLDARLLREFQAGSGKALKTIFKNLMPQGMINRFLEYCRVDGLRSASEVTVSERKRLLDGLFDLRLTVDSVMPVKYGIVTRGGVNTKEINPKTMESKLVKGLFFAGEVIDIDAKTGGYNMQAAFSTGWVCGDNV